MSFSVLNHLSQMLGLKGEELQNDYYHYFHSGKGKNDCYKDIWILYLLRIMKLKVVLHYSGNCSQLNLVSSDESCIWIGDLKFGDPTPTSTKKSYLEMVTSGGDKSGASILHYLDGEKVIAVSDWTAIDLTVGNLIYFLCIYRKEINYRGTQIRSRSFTCELLGKFIPDQVDYKCTDEETITIGRALNMSLRYVGSRVEKLVMSKQEPTAMKLMDISGHSKETFFFGLKVPKAGVGEEGMLLVSEKVDGYYQFCKTTPALVLIGSRDTSIDKPILEDVKKEIFLKWCENLLSTTDFNVDRFELNKKMKDCLEQLGISKEGSSNEIATTILSLCSITKCRIVASFIYSKVSSESLDGVFCNDSAKSSLESDYYDEDFFYSHDDKMQG